MGFRAELFDYLDHFGKTCTVREAASWRYRVLKKNWVALRHDIDHDLDLALELAHHEHARGIRASYYLLHTAKYWDDPRLGAKCRQLAAYGHEVGLHVDLVTEMCAGLDVGLGVRVGELLGELRGSGVRVDGVAGHGAKACYEVGCTNFWFWEEMRPKDPMGSEDLRSAEGIRLEDPRWQISYPEGDEIVIGGRAYPLWSVSMKAHGIRYEASGVGCDRYWSDTGGDWVRTGDPMGEDLTRGKHVVLMHPVWWRDAKKVYFVLSADVAVRRRVGSYLDAVTPIRVFDEWTARHERVGTEVREAEGLLVVDETRVRNAAAHHLKLVQGDVVETSSLIGVGDVDGVIVDENEIGVVGVRSSRGMDEVVDGLMREDGGLYERPGGKALVDLEHARWAWMTRRGRIREHVRRGMAGGDRSVRVGDVHRAGEVVARALGCVEHPLLREEFLVDSPIVVGDRVGAVESRGSVWDGARGVVKLGGAGLRGVMRVRSGEKIRGGGWWYRLMSGMESAPQVMIGVDDEFGEGEYVVGFVKVWVVGDVSLRVFGHSSCRVSGGVMREELGALWAGDGAQVFRFCFEVVDGADGVALSLVGPKVFERGEIRVEKIAFRAARMDVYGA